MSLKKLPKNKADVKFINPETMEVECTYNQCFTKFIESKEFVIKTPSWNDYKPIKHTSYFHKCTECGRSYASSEDKGKSIRDYEINGSRDPQLTANETKQLLKQLKKIYESTTQPEKKKMVTKVFNVYKGKLQNG